jgi:hypothetical protein
VIRGALALGLVLLAGCETGPPIVEIGTGVTAFESLEERQPIPLVPGAQGGFHLWIAVRAQGFDPKEVSVDVVSYPLEAERPRQTTHHLLDLPAQDGWLVRSGLVQVLSLPECYQDREVVVSVEATDSAGRSAHDERVVVPYWEAPIGTCAR